MSRVLSFPALSRFLVGEDGAVTVDWVVLTAAVVGLGLGSAAAVRSGTSALGSDVQSSLSSASVVSLALVNVSFRVLHQDAENYWNDIDARIQQIAGFNDATLLWSFENDLQIPFETAMANGFNDPCTGCRGAGNRLDLMYIELAELEKRGLATQQMRDYVADAERRYTARFP